MAESIILQTGPMMWTNHSLDTFLAPDLSKFSRADIPERSELAARSRTWLGGFVLRSIFTFNPMGELAQFGFVYVRRASASAHFYELGRLKTSEFLRKHSARAPAVSLYSHACDHWEAFVREADQAMSLISKVAGIEERFKKGDNSVLERLHGLRDASEHPAVAIQNPDTSAKAAFTVWLTDDGLRSAKHRLSWAEAAEVVDAFNSVITRLLKAGSDGTK